jgi:hypothetical protein
MTAVLSKTNIKAYVTGVVKAPKRVEDSMEETPFVASTV